VRVVVVPVYNEMIRIAQKIVTTTIVIEIIIMPNKQKKQFKTNKKDIKSIFI